jgi:hypothetical protein
VTLLTVADHVNDNVTLELGTPVSSDLADVVDTQLDKYVEKLIAEGTFTKEDIDEHKKWVWGMLGERSCQQCAAGTWQERR